MTGSGILEILHECLDGGPIRSEHSFSFFALYASATSPSKETAPAGMNFLVLIARGSIPAVSSAEVLVPSRKPFCGSYIFNGDTDGDGDAIC